MSSDMEQIEARLAAYIDGTLPPEQKAEIEAYLTANPGHGRLIAELKSIKAALANLPREKAPAEVMDGVQAQLERAVLLDGVEDHAGPTRVGRWPQLGAVAAMLLLAGGLGLLVYQVLPRENAAGPEYALLPASTRPTMPDSELPDTPVTLDAPSPRPETRAAPATADQDRLLVPTAATIAGAAAKDRPGNADAMADAVAPVAPGVALPPSTASARDAAVAPPGETAKNASVLKIAGPVRPVVIESDDPLLTRNLWAAQAASQGHAVRPGVGPADRSADPALAAVGPGEPFLIVSDVPSPDPAAPAAPQAVGPSGLAFGVAGVTAEVAQVSSATAATRPATSAPATTASASATRPAATQSAATRPAGDVLIVFRLRRPAASYPASRPAGLP